MGIDGCRSGWIAVWITNRGKRGFAIFPRIESILDLNAKMMMIDIPIGPPRKGNRACDEAALKVSSR
jgi:predicted RNase H-like nuclease